MKYIFVLSALQSPAPQVRSLQLAWLHVHCVTAVPFSPMVRVACVSYAQELLGQPILGRRVGMIVKVSINTLS